MTQKCFRGIYYEADWGKDPVIIHDMKIRSLSRKLTSEELAALHGHTLLHAIDGIPEGECLKKELLEELSPRGQKARDYKVLMTRLKREGISL